MKEEKRTRFLKAMVRLLIMRAKLRWVSRKQRLSPKAIKHTIDNRIGKLVYNATHGLQTVPLYKGVCHGCDKLVTARWLIGYVYGTSKDGLYYHALRPVKCKCGAIHFNFLFTHNLWDETKYDVTPATSLINGTFYNRDTKEQSVFTAEQARLAQEQAEAEQ